MTSKSLRSTPRWIRAIESRKRRHIRRQHGMANWYVEVLAGLTSRLSSVYLTLRTSIGEFDFRCNGLRCERAEPVTMWRQHAE